MSANTCSEESISSRVRFVNGGRSVQQKVRITLDNGLGTRRSYDQTFWTHEKTPGVAAQELISSIVLRDGDTIEISFLGEVA